MALSPEDIEYLKRRETEKQAEELHRKVTADKFVQFFDKNDLKIFIEAVEKAPLNVLNLKCKSIYKDGFNTLQAVLLACFNPYQEQMLYTLVKKGVDLSVCIPSRVLPEYYPGLSIVEYAMRRDYNILISLLSQPQIPGVVNESSPFCGSCSSFPLPVEPNKPSLTDEQMKISEKLCGLVQADKFQNQFTEEDFKRFNEFLENCTPDIIDADHASFMYHPERINAVQLAMLQIHNPFQEEMLCALIRKGGSRDARVPKKAHADYFPGCNVEEFARKMKYNHLLVDVLQCPPALESAKEHELSGLLFQFMGSSSQPQASVAAALIASEANFGHSSSSSTSSMSSSASASSSYSATASAAATQLEDDSWVELDEDEDRKMGYWPAG